jgi:hypothetical protein
MRHASEARPFDAKFSGQAGTVSRRMPKPRERSQVFLTNEGKSKEETVISDE